jgi:hypothetical protein
MKKLLLLAAVLGAIAYAVRGNREDVARYRRIRDM